MRNLLYIPRAIFDILRIWFFDISLQEKSSFTYTLFLLKWNKWVQPQNIVITVPFKKYRLKVYNSETTQFLFKEIFLHRVYRLPLIRADKILDAGANIGLATIYFHKEKPEAKIVAYEPAQSAFDLLKVNVNFVNANVEAYKKAVSDFNGDVFEESVGEPSAVNQKFSLSGSGARIDCERLSEKLETGNYDVVKLDVEGTEENILKDCFEKNVIQKVNCWFIEFHNKSSVAYWIKMFEIDKFHYRKKQNVYCFWK
jgi:FkbM family methyltransferase